MLAIGASFSDYIVGVHSAAAVIAFGPLFAFPVMSQLAARSDARMLPFVHRLQRQIGRMIIDPGLAVVLVAGIYLASDLHDWKRFFVGWGVAVTLVLGGLEGAVMIRSEGRLAELAGRDLAAAAGASGGVRLSDEYRAAARLHTRVGGVMALLVVATVIIMAVGQAG